MSAQEQAYQSVPVPPQVPADGGGQGTASLLLQKPLLSCVPHCYAQEVSRLCHLSAGTYRVVPSTYLPDTEGSFTVTIATRIDRWGHAAGCGPQCHLRPVFSCLPHRPSSAVLAEMRLTRVPADALPVSLWGGAWMGLGMPVLPHPPCGWGARRADGCSFLQALHPQPGKAGAAPPGGMMGPGVLARPAPSQQPPCRSGHAWGHKLHLSLPLRGTWQSF